jgi:hypothetical protein
MTEKYIPLFMYLKTSRSKNQHRNGVRHGPRLEIGWRALETRRVDKSLKMRFMQSMSCGWKPICGEKLHCTAKAISTLIESSAPRLTAAPVFGRDPWLEELPRDLPASCRRCVKH